MLPIGSMTRQGTAQSIIDSYLSDLDARRKTRHDELKKLYGDKYMKYAQDEENKFGEPEKKKEYKSYKGKDYEVKYDEDGRPYIDIE